MSRHHFWLRLSSRLVDKSRLRIVWCLLGVQLLGIFILSIELMSFYYVHKKAHGHVAITHVPTSPFSVTSTSRAVRDASPSFPKQQGQASSLQPQLVALSQSASAAGITLSRLKLQPSQVSETPVAVITMTSTYVQYKKFLKAVLQANTGLVLQKLVANRLPAPATSVSFEAKVAFVPVH